MMAHGYVNPYGQWDINLTKSINLLVPIGGWKLNVNENGLDIWGF
jgi:hypothetical protein